MSSTKKNARRKSNKAKSSKIQEDLIDFNSWFWFKTKAKKVRESQKNEIKVFFKAKGLKEQETKEKYEEILKLY